MEPVSLDNTLNLIVLVQEKTLFLLLLFGDPSLMSSVQNVAKPLVGCFVGTEGEIIGFSSFN